LSINNARYRVFSSIWKYQKCRIRSYPWI